jgi:hypothetical protein
VDSIHRGKWAIAVPVRDPTGLGTPTKPTTLGIYVLHNRVFNIRNEEIASAKSASQ